jgi:hypothetical protein
MKPFLDAEARWAAIGIASCIGAALAIASYAVVSQPVSSRGGLSWYGEFFLATGAFLLSPAAVVFLALLGRPRLAAVGGIAVALSLYQAAMLILEITVYGGQGLLFPFVYLFSLPGAALGALAIILFLRTRAHIAPFAAFCISAAAVLAGVATNQTVVCNTVIPYCPMPWAIHQSK